MSRAWMPLYVADYLRDTGHLSTVQHGAYLLLIMHYWNKGPLPDDPKQLQRITKLDSREWYRHWPILKEFFVLRPREVCEESAANSSQAAQANAEQLLGKCWFHKRLDKEIEKAELLRVKRQIAGQKGGEASRGLTNLGRYVNGAIAKQTGTQSQSPSKTTSSISEPREAPVEKAKGTSEGGSKSLLPSASLTRVIKASGWVS